VPIHLTGGKKGRIGIVLARVYFFYCIPEIFYIKPVQYITYAEFPEFICLISVSNEPYAKFLSGSEIPMPVTYIKAF